MHHIRKSSKLKLLQRQLLQFRSPWFKLSYYQLLSNLQLLPDKLPKAQFIYGMSLISTIFILLIMSLLTQFILNISQHNLSTINIILQGQRALFAAKSGIAWGITNALANNNCPIPTTIQLNQAGNLDFTVNVTCNYINPTTLKLTATANYGQIQESTYVTRTITSKYIIPNNLNNPNNPNNPNN